MNSPMTTTASAAHLLGDTARMRGVSAMVRRRVPACDADDVTQTVLCDALSAPKLPSEPSELRRFLCVLARNKIADFHRRVRKVGSASDDACEEIAVAPSPIEARSLLARVVDATSPRDRETLEWLVREHEGEELKEIAADVGLPAPTVRKRVSRLRRALRTRWAHALLVIVGAGGAAAATRHASRDDVSSITADPIVDVSAGVILAGQGHWRIAPDYALVHSTRGTIDTSAVEVSIDGRNVVVTGPLRAIPGARLAWSITSTRRVDSRMYTIELRDEHGRVQHATVFLESQAMKITFRDGPLKGSARLVRRP